MSLQILHGVLYVYISWEMKTPYRHMYMKVSKASLIVVNISETDGKYHGQIFPLMTCHDIVYIQTNANILQCLNHMM